MRPGRGSYKTKAYKQLFMPGSPKGASSSFYLRSSAFAMTYM